VTSLLKRTLDYDVLVLGKGNHPEDADTGPYCVMEAVAYVAGEKHTDHPECVSPVIGAFCRTWNDDLDDATRQRLKPYIPRLVGTRASKKVEDARAWLVTDWMVRVHTPAWLELGGMKEQADALRALPEILSADVAEKAQPTIDGARKKAAASGAAAWDVARDAAGAAAWDAAGAAAGAASGAAAWDVVARDAAGAAARAAAWDAAGAAAWDGVARDAAGAAAWAALKPTVVSLQDSAFALLDRLIDAREI
jgi:hypothetical protein